MGETVSYISNELNSHNLRKGVAVDFKITLPVKPNEIPTFRIAAIQRKEN